jgi:ATP-dependent Clp protease adaptor protein ClpS
MAPPPEHPKEPNDPSRTPGGPNAPATPKQGGDEQVDVKERQKSATAKRYRVIFHNDDYTTMEFVVGALIRFFHKTEAEATHVMLTVHKKGSGVAGVYTRDVAETKVEQVMQHAKENGMPLMVTAEAE